MPSPYSWRAITVMELVGGGDRGKTEVNKCGAQMERGREGWKEGRVTVGQVYFPWEEARGGGGKLDHASNLYLPKKFFILAETCQKLY